MLPSGDTRCYWLFQAGLRDREDACNAYERAHPHAPPHLQSDVVCGDRILEARDKHISALKLNIMAIPFEAFLPYAIMFGVSPNISQFYA